MIPKPLPVLSSPGVILNGVKADRFNEIDPKHNYPDVLSFKIKFGLLLPATNTSMEHELWSIIFNNQGHDRLDGIGIHTSSVVTPAPILASKEDLFNYRDQFLAGLKGAVDSALLAAPDYLILGMSLEHILYGLSEIRKPIDDLNQYAGIGCTTWHDAALAALQTVKAKRIGIISPFDITGDQNARKMFEDMGYEVAASVGFSCAHAMHIAHIPDSAKEKAILDLLQPDKNKLDAIIQCGTNMSLLKVTEKLEPKIGIPILGINAVSFWHALRANGITCSLNGAGILLRDY